MLGLCSSLPLLAQAYRYHHAHVDTALSYVGVVELGTNDGPEIRRFLAAVGLGAGNPYCAAFVSFCLDAVRPFPAQPTTRSGLASKFIGQRSRKASLVLAGSHRPVLGDLVIWQKGNTVFGHIGIVLAWDGACGYTVEANTSSGVFGSQRDGDGVFVRYRCIQPGNYFRITYFTSVVYVV